MRIWSLDDDVYADHISDLYWEKVAELYERDEC